MMIREQRFTMFRLLIPLWQQDAVVHGVLRLENGEEYPLSGFPRRLKSFARGTRMYILLIHTRPIVICDFSGQPPTQRRSDLDLPQMPTMPSWSAPTDRDRPSLGTWSSELSLRSLTLNEMPMVASHQGIALSSQPGSVEFDRQVPSYEEIEDQEEVTALPRYTR
jgi:hypothetical protein